MGLPTCPVQCSRWLLFTTCRTGAFAPGPCEPVTTALRRAQPDSVPPSSTPSVYFGFDGSRPAHQTSRRSTFPTNQPVLSISMAATMPGSRAHYGTRLPPPLMCRRFRQIALECSWLDRHRSSLKKNMSRIRTGSGRASARPYHKTFSPERLPPLPSHRLPDSVGTLSAGNVKAETVSL